MDLFNDNILKIFISNYPCAKIKFLSMLNYKKCLGGIWFKGVK